MVSVTVRIDILVLWSPTLNLGIVPPYTRGDAPPRDARVIREHESGHVARCRAGDSKPLPRNLVSHSLDVGRLQQIGRDTDVLEHRNVALRQLTRRRFALRRGCDS